MEDLLTINTTQEPASSRAASCSALNDLTEYCRDEQKWAEDALASPRDSLQEERLRTRKNVFAELLSVIGSLRNEPNELEQTRRAQD